LTTTKPNIATEKKRKGGKARTPLPTKRTPVSKDPAEKKKGGESDGRDDACPLLRGRNWSGLSLIRKEKK